MMAAVFALIFSQTDRFRPSGLTREIVLKNYRQRYGQEQSRSCLLNVTKNKHSNKEIIQYFFKNQTNKIDTFI